jgi:hypothetical protein
LGVSSSECASIRTRSKTRNVTATSAVTVQQPGAEPVKVGQAAVAPGDEFAVQRQAARHRLELWQQPRHRPAAPAPHTQRNSVETARNPSHFTSNRQPAPTGGGPLRASIGSGSAADCIEDGRYRCGAGLEPVQRGRAV